MTCDACGLVEVRIPGAFCPPCGDRVTAILAGPDIDHVAVERVVRDHDRSVVLNRLERDAAWRRMEAAGASAPVIADVLGVHETWVTRRRSTRSGVAV